ncbi:MAG: hypothetical protein CM15mV141_150 [uncultured marine virus]|nr:MAG: hypothetical protein CM15mV141_150 [uncultured marine virus]
MTWDEWGSKRKTPTPMVNNYVEWKRERDVLMYSWGKIY